MLCSSAQPQPPSPLAFISLLVSPLPGGAQLAERFVSTRLPPRLALLPRGFRLIWRRNRRRNRSQPPPVCKHPPCALFCEKKNSLLTVELGTSRPPCRGAGREGPGLSIPKDPNFLGAWQDAERTQRGGGATQPPHPQLVTVARSLNCWTDLNFENTQILRVFLAPPGDLSSRGDAAHSLHP